MTRYHGERHERDSVMMPARLYNTSFPVDDSMERMRSTLDLIPARLAASSRYGTTSGAGVVHPRHVGHPRRRIRMPIGGSDGPNWLAP